MKVAIIGGGASGMTTAYLLNKKKHHVTVFEKQSVLGGNICTLNKNVKINTLPSTQILENGVVEFSEGFHNFLNLMKELEVELETIDIGTGLFLKDGRRFLSFSMIQKNVPLFRRVLEYLKLGWIYTDSIALNLQVHVFNTHQFHDKPLSRYTNTEHIKDYWLKLFIMYSYSIPFDLINEVPSEIALPALRNYLWTNWVRIKGGVYSYIEKIIEHFNGEILLNTKILGVTRNKDSVQITLPEGLTQTFDKVVFATTPDQVLALLSDPTDEEIKRFAAWKKNQVSTIIHTDPSMYAKYKIKQFSGFDFFQTEHGWGYNANLNELCKMPPLPHYNLSYNLDALIAKEKTVHLQEHHTPLYTVEAFKYRDEVIGTNGENHTYHAGAYLADGLHEGAVTSAMRVAQLMG
ncbi:FAD-dependent oxidoreductase [Deltaproteobacteria bacterium TL4]